MHDDYGKIPTGATGKKGKKKGFGSRLPVSEGGGGVEKDTGRASDRKG